MKLVQCTREQFKAAWRRSLQEQGAGADEIASALAAADRMFDGGRAVYEHIAANDPITLAELEEDAASRRIQ